MVYKQYRSYCLAGESGFPAEAVPVSAPFAPLLLCLLYTSPSPRDS